jgi:hypothetical protein
MLPIASPSSEQQTCLDKNTQYEAWSCDLPPGSIEMTVSPLASSASNTSGNNVTISGSGVSLAFFYGSQPPKIDPDAILKLANDAEQTRLGPAWYFQVLYDKVVVVPESAFPLPSKTKRDKEQRDYGDWVRKAVAQEGDKPWFCHWEGTILETFIYVNQSSGSSGNQQASISASMAKATPTSTPSTRDSYAPAQSTATASSGSKLVAPLDNYPKIVKVEERRNPADSRSKAPYCVQMVILPDDSARPFLNKYGEQITIYLNETEPSLTFSGAKRGESDEVNVPAALELMERDDTGIPHMCRCVWFTEKLT